jgi:hypothetical protein
VSKILSILGRTIGTVTGGVASAAWMIAMWVPSAGLTLSGISFVAALVMALSALFAAIASVRGHTVVVVLVFLASFFPVGLFLSTTDHWLKWVGRLDVGFLIAAVLMWAGSRSAKPANAAGGQ